MVRAEGSLHQAVVSGTAMMFDSSMYLPRSVSQFQLRYALRETYRYIRPAVEQHIGVDRRDVGPERRRLALRQRGRRLLLIRPHQQVHVVVVRVVRVEVDRAAVMLRNGTGRRARDGDADLARLLEVLDAEPLLLVGVRAGGVEHEVPAGARVLVDLRRPEPVVAPLVGSSSRQRATREALPRREVGGAVDAEVVAGAGPSVE
jgi:hypothetical protein